MKDIVTMNLQIDLGEDTDEEELDFLTRQLREEIEELDVESAELVSGEAAPEGAKGDPVTLGALAVAVLPVVLPELIKVVQGWLKRGDNRTVKIKTQIGDRSVEVEYSPQTMSTSELTEVVDTLTEAISEQ